MSLKNDWTPNDTLKNNNVNDIANATNTNTQHRETKINKDTFVHGLKYNDSKNSLILDGESGEVEIGGVGTSDDVTFNPDSTDLVADNVSDAIKEINDKINKHEDLSIASESGVHNFKYDPDTKSLYYYYDGQWLVAEIEGTGKVSVSGLTADTIKSGVTVVVKRGEEEITRIVGTFTNDSNAVASDILSGKTAYVGGQKVTGNIPIRQGQQIVSVQGSSGDVLVTGAIENAYYQNCTIGFKKDNLKPDNIRKGVRVFDINGTFTQDANASASDIISGKTAYVNGNKITGNMRSMSGDQYAGSPTVSGSYLYMPYMSNGYYSNARQYFNKGNLSPENIKQGVNIFGVYGNMSPKDEMVAGIVFARNSNYGERRVFMLASLDSSLFDNETSGHINYIGKFKNGASVNVYTVVLQRIPYEESYYSDPALNLGSGGYFSAGTTISAVNLHTNSSWDSTIMSVITKRI